MSQKTILFAGCSFTAECGFSDTRQEQYHWPKVFSRHYNCSYQNISIGGCSNNEIFLKTVENTVDKKFDLVVVMWSAIGRQWIYHSDHNIDFPTSINFGNLRGFRHSNSEVFDYAKLHYAYFNNDYINLKHWLLSTIALAKYFDSIQQPYIFVRGFENYVNDFDNLSYNSNQGFLNMTLQINRLLDFENNSDDTIQSKADVIKNLINYNKKFNWINLLTPGFYESSVDYADDGIHPGIESNRIFCNQLIDYCTKEKLL
jgi:hypothetical protein